MPVDVHTVPLGDLISRDNDDDDDDVRADAYEGGVEMHDVTGIEDGDHNYDDDDDYGGDDDTRGGSAGWKVIVIGLRRHFS
eukprot:CAMPEP_0185269286 /NCGR_PEP_ID=MMETSP1359-20130426/39362_1 /TAXON_ID=552665 /ORGANISM="Bigelowiella longifila, Strain CCMP242" /LENGTH=80 /DNA_ID=CAMNT_0027860383 /DNA_START=1 /DNA_END=241 /DNA_ORIENTATION=-